MEENTAIVVLQTTFINQQMAEKIANQQNIVEENIVYYPAKIPKAQRLILLDLSTDNEKMNAEALLSYLNENKLLSSLKKMDLILSKVSVDLPDFVDQLGFYLTKNYNRKNIQINTLPRDNYNSTIIQPPVTQEKWQIFGTNSKIDGINFHSNKIKEDQSHHRLAESDNIFTLLTPKNFG